MIFDLILAIQALGLPFLGIVLLLFVSVYLEQMAAAYKSPPLEEGASAPTVERVDFGGFTLAVLTTCTPAMQLLHAFFGTLGFEGRNLLVAVGLPAAAILIGALAGRLVGIGWKSGARYARGWVLPAALIAFVFTVYVTWPSLIALAELLSGRSVRMHVLRPA